MLSVSVAVILSAAAPASESGSKNEPALVFGRVASAVMIVKATLPQGTSQGSAVIVAPGIAVTNFHVVRGGKSITVTQGATTVPATLLRFDEKHDLALLSFELDRRPVSIAGARSAKVGDRVYALGAPHGLELTLSDGLVSSLREDAKGGAPMLQTTAPISPGSSGGGLFDGRGRLIGITTWQTSGQNLNFAHPAEWVTELLEGKGGKGGFDGGAPVVPQFTVTTRPKNVKCSLEERSVWGMFADGPELLESQPYKGEMAFWGFDGQTPSRGDKELVLRDLSRKSGYVDFEGTDRGDQYYFLFEDDGSIRLTKAEVINFKGQPRLVTRSGPCAEVASSAKKSSSTNDVAVDADRDCINGNAAVCLQLGQATEGAIALVYFRRACEGGEEQGCSGAAKLYEGVGDKANAAKFRAAAKGATAHTPLAEAPGPAGDAGVVAPGDGRKPLKKQ